MSKARIAFLILLFMAPWVFLIGVGSYYLWTEGWMRWAWIPMFLCIALSYFLAWRWTKKPGLLPPTETPEQNYWTERDKKAWEKVLAKAKTYDKITLDQLSDPKHYTDLGIDLAVQVSQEYNPDATSAATAFDLLTLPEVMTCIELAAADLNEMVQKYVPGSHMLRIKDTKRAKQVKQWYTTGQNVYWAGSAIINPVETAMRFFASRGILGNLLDKLQSNILLWFHTAFIHSLGHYLVELNSGRLKVGVKRYRELLAASKEPPVEASPTPEFIDGQSPALPLSPKVKPIEIAVLGAVKAGKSSLVNALLGQPVATIDTLPVEHVGTRYNMTLPNGQIVSLLDTAGYGQEGPNEDEFATAAEASQDADLILLVTPANNPGRKADVELLDRLKAYFDERQHLKLPPIVLVVNQVDLLSPKNEWNPPYNWQTGTRPKESNIRECLAAVKEQIGPRAVEVVPTCSRANETFGIKEALIPVIAMNLDDARGASVLKAFEAESAADQFKKLGSQVVQGAKKAWGILMESLKKS